MKPIRPIFLACAMFLGPGFAVADEPSPLTLVGPVPDAESGRALFGAKGCVVCHSVNGIGGEAGPPLDTISHDGEVNPLDFAARMWSGASAMAVLQEMEFGYQIDLSGQDIADLAAFVSSDEQLNAFSETDVPDEFRGWTIDRAIIAFGETATEGTDGTGNVARGYLLAERWCSDCHVVAPGDYGGVAGPTFDAIAARSGASEGEIVDWLSEPHSEMPEFLNLTDADIASLAAYILSLQR